MPEAPLVYLDANVYMDLITRNEGEHPETGDPRWRTAEIILQAIEQGKVSMAASSLVEAEVLVNGTTRQRSERSSVLRDKLNSMFNSPRVAWTDIDRFLVRDSVRIAEECEGKKFGKNKFPAADALHLAAAARMSCDFLMTYDRGFPIGHKIRDVSVIFPAVVWGQTLFGL